MMNDCLMYLLGLGRGFNMHANKKIVEEFQYWTPQQQSEYHLCKLRPLLQHAYEHVPYYRCLFDKHNLLPEDICTIDDLEKIPITRKQDVLDNPEIFIADNAHEFHAMHRHTGGTTGTPVAYYTDVNTWAMNWALKMRTFEWGGYHYGKDRLAVMAGGSLLPGKQAGIKHQIWRMLNNYYSMPIMHLTDDIMKEYYYQIKRQKIRFMRGYPSALATFAEYLKRNNLYLPLKAVFTTAEMLFPFQRELFKAVFGCEVYNTYGCGDGMGNATECEEHKGLHVCQEISIMQIVDEAGKEVLAGNEGEIVLTDLYDYTMPFIRYAPGDRAIKADANCTCGRISPMIEKIIGRSSDTFKLKNGRTLNAFSFPIESLTDEIDKFQIVQESIDDVRLLVIPKKNISEKRLQELTTLLQYHCGDDITVKVKLVNNIEVPKSGKMRFVISKVKDHNV